MTRNEEHARTRRPRPKAASAAQAEPHAAPPGALALAIEGGDWERASLLLLIALARAARAAPPGTIDDLLALLSEDGEAS